MTSGTSARLRRGSALKRLLSGDGWSEADAALFAASFAIALSIYYAVVEGPGRLNHDMAEAYMWGREFQLGYYQHPPFWAWIAGAWFSIMPHEIWAFGILSAANAGVGVWASWKLIGNFAQGPKRTAATALLLLTTSFSVYAFKYNANIIFISLWPLTANAFVRSLRRPRPLEGAVFGLTLGLCFLSKYYAAVFVLTFAFVAFAEGDLRRYLASPAPYVAAGAALLVIAPHVVWLASNGSPPFRYFESVSGLSAATTFGQARETLFGAVRMAAPALAFVAYARWRWRAAGAPERPTASLWILSVGPLALTVALGFLLRTHIISDMIVGVLPLAPLLAIDLASPFEERALARAATRTATIAAAGAVALSPLISFATAHWSARAAKVEPYREVAFIVEDLWRDTFRTPLRYVAGDDVYEKAVEFYAPDAPRAVVDFELPRTPWISRSDLDRDGFVVICEIDDSPCARKIDEFRRYGDKLIEFAAAHRSWGYSSGSVRFRALLVPPDSVRSPENL